MSDRKIGSVKMFVEKELGARISQWEQEKCKNFLVDGCPFMDYVQAQWAAHETEKKVAKDQRVKARAKEMEQEMKWGSKPTTPVKRRFIGTTTPTKTPKRRKALNGSAAPSPAVGRIGTKNSSVCPSPAISGRPPRSMKTKTPARPKIATPVKRTRRALADHNQDTESASPFSTTTLSGASSTTASNISTMSLASTTCMSYTDFSHGLNVEGRKNYRSSALPSPTNGRV
uniref:Protein regulator of cytokinesis 1-like n=1 Tax=Saccoglossus kowalevskii TaxID=10224 RepID=A0ABM0LVK8_SACKO|nr:PREDICTED: protein regulator of cytokinesis 1-like [Saccoglossus kowalevskii]